MEYTQVPGCKILLNGAKLTAKRDPMQCRACTQALIYLYHHSWRAKKELKKSDLSKVLTEELTLEEDPGHDILQESIGKCIWVLL